MRVDFTGGAADLRAIVPTVAEATGFAFYEAGEPRKQLLDYLREKNVLLQMGYMWRYNPGINAALATSIFLMAFATVAGAQGLKTAQEIVGFSTSKTSAFPI